MLTLQNAIIAAVFAIGMFVGWHASSIWSGWETSAKLMKQASALTQQCDNATKVTKDANDQLRKDNDRIRDRLAISKRVRAVCTIPLGSEAIAILGRAGYAVRNGISSEWLYEYAAQCETYRSERIVLEKFIDDQLANARK